MQREEVRLHGAWASIYSKRVDVALKIKGIAYEHVEEDWQNKSQALLEYNPVQKKIPVLVHNGKPIAESLIILEYIDEVWPNHIPRLMPEDPYQRARVRFWASFFDNQLVASEFKVFQSRGKDQEDALNELYEKLSMMEREMGDLIPRDISTIQEGSLGLLDIQLGLSLGVYRAQEQVLGKKILDAEKHPLLFSWVTTLVELPVIKQLIPPHDKLVNLLQNVFREYLPACCSKN